MLDEMCNKMLDYFRIRNDFKPNQHQSYSEAVRMEILLEISKNLEHGDSAAVKEFLRKALSMNIAPETILNMGLINGSCREKIQEE
jgi:methanogenic corrinoid protein MtbC1